MPQNYTTGTVTVTNGSAVVTGSGTAWELALITGGLFCCAGYSVPIASVASDTSLTLALPWPGTTGAGKAYAIFRETAYAASAVMANDRLAEVAQDLRSPSVTALAGLTLAADKLPYGTGANTLGLADFKASARSLIGLTAAADKLPYFTSGTAAGLADFKASARSLLALTAAADQLPYYTSGTAAGLATLTAFARTILDDTDAAGVRNTIGLGDAATKTVQATAEDATAGRVLTVGAFGLGGQIVTSEVNLNNYFASGAYITPSSGLLNLPDGWSQGRYVITVDGGTSYCSQTLTNPFTGEQARRSFATTWLPWRITYDRTNVIGQLSQSGGVPTGAILNAGSNANGNWQVSADGTMVCESTSQTLTFANVAVLNKVWIFPQTFVSTPVVIVSHTGSIPAGHREAVMYGAGISTSQATLSKIDNAGTYVSGDTVTVSAVARGRWF